MNRKDRRAKAAVKKRQVKAVARANGQSAPTLEEADPAVLAMKVKAIEQALEKFSSVYATNLKEFKNAFTMTDQHLFVTQRILNDAALGRQRWVPVHPEDKKYLESNPSWPDEQRRCWMQLNPTNDKGEVIGMPVVNLGWYHWQYYQMRQLEGLIGFLKKLGAWQPEEARIVAPDETEEVEYFGGDQV